MEQMKERKKKKERKKRGEDRLANDFSEMCFLVNDVVILTNFEKFFVLVFFFFCVRVCALRERGVHVLRYELG